MTTCHCPGIVILRSAPRRHPWVVGLGGGGSALVPLNTRRTCTSPSRGTSCIPNRYVVPGRYTYVPTMGDVDGPRRDRRPQRRPSNASNAVWPLTLCFIRVSDHLFVSRPPTRANGSVRTTQRIVLIDLNCLTCDDLSLSWDSYFTVGAAPPPLGRRPRRRRYGARTPKYTAYFLIGMTLTCTSPSRGT